MATAAGRAEEIYTTGPETLAARVAQIVSGPVSAYSKQVIATSEPPGPSAIPLQWVVTGRVDSPAPLKGPATKAVSFSKTEPSLALGDPREISSWELDYGQLRPSGQVVLFLSGDPAKPVIKALPSGDGERDLASLLRDIVAIESNPVGEKQMNAWFSYLGSARTDHGREAALRSLVQMKADWKRMRAALEGLDANASRSERICRFTFGIVVFGLTSQAWEPDQISVADFLGRKFESARTPGLELQYILSLKLALRYTMEESERAMREPIRERIMDSLKRSESRASKTPELADQYRQIRAAYPALF